MTNLFTKVPGIACMRGDPAKLACRLHANDSKWKSKYKVVSFVLTHYVNLVKKYEETFPTATKFYKTFSAGIKAFKDDGLLLFKVYKKLNTHGIYSLTRKELEVYHEMPKNMFKVAPIIVIGTGLPFGAAVFAFGCMFPKRTLSHHFWSKVQKNEFALIDHKKKLECYKSIISSLQAHLKYVQCNILREHTSKILKDMERGASPTVQDVLACKQLFKEPPYSIQSLGASHIRLLLKLHTLHQGWRRKARLQKHSTLMQAMDIAIMREGGVCVLDRDELKRASFFRGLNPINMKEEDIKHWLRNWILISKEIDDDCCSLLLHCPVLLGYNQPIVKVKASTFLPVYEGESTLKTYGEKYVMEARI